MNQSKTYVKIPKNDFMRIDDTRHRSFSQSEIYMASFEHIETLKIRSFGVRFSKDRERCEFEFAYAEDPLLLLTMTCDAFLKIHAQSCFAFFSHEYNRKWFKTGFSNESIVTVLLELFLRVGEKASLDNELLIGLSNFLQSWLSNPEAKLQPW